MHKTHFFILFSSVFMCGVHPKTGRNQLCRLRRSANFAGRIEKHQADAYYTDTLYTKQKKTGAFFAKCRFFGAKCNFAATAVHPAASLCRKAQKAAIPVRRPFSASIFLSIQCFSAALKFYTISPKQNRCVSNPKGRNTPIRFHA
jgi:hypothetical protein